jgi:hypothetical protein
VLEFNYSIKGWKSNLFPGPEGASRAFVYGVKRVCLWGVPDTCLACTRVRERSHRRPVQKIDAAEDGKSRLVFFV